MIESIPSLDAVTGGNVTTGSPPSLSSRNFAEDWVLDATGNCWWSYMRDQNGDYNLVPGDDLHRRFQNKANETTAIDKYMGMYGYPWADPAHDRAGNMTEMPQPNALTSLYAATYDAWNRLVRIDDLGLEDSSSSGTPPTVVEYAYDGRNFRITRTAYADGEPDETRHFYYNNQWQCLEERIGALTDADVHYVWGLRYIDDLLFRERDTSVPKDGGFDERVYALQDPNFNVVALAQRPQWDAEIVERYRYDAYGTPTVLNPSFTVRAGGTQYAWQHLFTTRRRDPATALMHYRNRDYHPQLGRFVTRDPVGT